MADRLQESLCQYHAMNDTGKPDARKRARPVWGKGVEKGLLMWYLVGSPSHKNASDAVFKIFQQEYSAIRPQLEQEVAAAKLDKDEITPISQERGLTQAEQRRYERMQQAYQYLQQGWSQKEIARQLGIHPKTVRRYIHRSSPQAPRQRTYRLLDRYKPYLLQRWNEGCRNGMQLYREIQAKGFAGHETTVRNFIQQLRRVREKNGKVLDGGPT